MSEEKSTAEKAEKAERLTSQFGDNDAFPGDPEINTPDGVFKFGMLDLDDLSSWCSKLHAIWKREQASMIKPGIPAESEFRIRRTIEYTRPNLDDVANACDNPDGVKSILLMSLKKGGSQDNKADWEIVKRHVRNTKLSELARKVSRLFIEVPNSAPKNLPPDVEASAKGQPQESPDLTNRTGSVPPLEQTAGTEGSFPG